MRIPVLYEPVFEKNSVWCDQIKTEMEALAKLRKYSLLYIDAETYRTADYDCIFVDAPRLILVVSTTQNWIRRALDFFSEKQISVVLADCYPFGSPCIRGQVCFDYENAVRTLVAYLTERCACRRIALYGVYRNSSSDYLKKEAFLREMTGRGEGDGSTCCFENKTGLSDCYRAFRAQVSEFDAVICVNDIAAIHLARRLKEDGIRIPEQIQITSCIGSTKLSETADPPITMLCPESPSIGHHAVLTFRYLYRAEPQSVSSSVKISGKLVKRATTRERTVSREEVPDCRPVPELPALDFYEDDAVIVLSKAEKLLLACTDTDLGILRKLSVKESVDAIAEELYLSRSAVFYRIRRMEELSGTGTLREFKGFLRKHHISEMIGLTGMSDPVQNGFPGPISAERRGRGKESG